MEKWGRHQYRQTIRALNLQYKGNFRDPCLSSFGGQLFNDIADRADDIFNGMPPPEESLKAEMEAMKNQAVVNIADQNDFKQVLNTQSNYAGAGDAGGGNGGGDSDGGGCRGCGCFAGDSLIQMKDGSTKQVSLLRKGDQVKTPTGYATIRCLV